VVRLGSFALSGACVAWLSGALKESQGVIRATLESIGDAVIATDRRGRVRLLNPTAEALTGWSHHEARGRQLSEVFRSVRTETGEELPVPAPDRLPRHSHLPVGVSLVSRTGHRIPVDDSLAPVQTDSGRILGSILVFRDATRRKQSEAAALESERDRLRGQRMEAVGRLAGGVAHDFNNVLTVINGYADLLLKQIAAESPARGSAEAILKAGERAAGLTRQLLLFSRGQLAKPQVVDLNQVVANFEKMLRRLIGEDINLVVHLAARPLLVLADVGQIEQVIMNLATNARDAMPLGGRLTLSTGLKQLRVNGSEAGAGEAGLPHAELNVADTGIGMEPETLTHLFEPFFTTKNVHQGTGLGLSVSYGIVKSHKGHCRVDSRPGQGSVFHISLPLTEAAPEEEAAPPTPESPVPVKATILLVEDNHEVRHLMRDLLKAAGYEVMEAPGVEEAMAIERSHPGRIDLLVTDIVMPGFSGVELRKRMAAQRPGMGVLYVSGYSGQEVASRALEDGAVAYLQKPFTPDELAREVAESIARSRKSSSD
jgi:PAS domain S-box-containing protein